MKSEKLEVVRGSGNVFRDLGHKNADADQFRAILGAEIIKALDREGLSVRGAQGRAGIAAADFSRIRNANLGRFTVDRLMSIINRLGSRVEVKIKVSFGISRSGGRPLRCEWASDCEALQILLWRIDASDPTICDLSKEMKKPWRVKMGRPVFTNNSRTISVTALGANHNQEHLKLRSRSHRMRTISGKRNCFPSPHHETLTCDLDVSFAVKNNNERVEWRGMFAKTFALIEGK
ncbi:MAG TPA: helix-turn-helix transcriptional regulator [Pyrinomonadaceae bacterium]